MLIDPERHALEMRIERAKSRIVEDLNRASARRSARWPRRPRRRWLGTVAVVAGVLLAGIVVGALARRSRRRVRIQWR